MPTRHVYFPYELYEKIRHEPNLSSLVTTLLIDYYKTKEINHMTLEEKKKRLAKIQAEIEFKKKLEEIDHE